MKLLTRLLAITTQKDDSPEAGLSGDLDELPEEEKQSDLIPPGEKPVLIEEVTEDD